MGTLLLPRKVRCNSVVREPVSEELAKVRGPVSQFLGKMGALISVQYTRIWYAKKPDAHSIWLK